MFGRFPILFDIVKNGILIHIPIQKIKFASTENSGSPFSGPKIRFSFLAKVPETNYPKVNLHKRQSDVDKGVICLRRVDLVPLCLLGPRSPFYFISPGTRKIQQNMLNMWGYIKFASFNIILYFCD